MTRNSQSEYQIPGTSNSANNIQDSSLSFEKTYQKLPEKMHPSTANGINQPGSNPWENNGIKENNFTFSNSMFKNTGTPAMSSTAFSWVDNSVANSLSKNLSELNIRDDRPRPTKIRRRNALTIMDQHFPNPSRLHNLCSYTRKDRCLLYPAETNL